MTVLIQLGSCGASWPQNTTPIQRLKVISRYFDKVVLVDTESEPSPHLYYDHYVHLDGFNPLAISRILHDYRDENVVIWFGPSSRIAMSILFLRLFTRFYFVIDLYDHEHLSSGIARARGAKLKALKYRLFEYFIVRAARRADLLVSAIAEERYVDLPNRVKAINGVATHQLSGIGTTNNSDHSMRSKKFIICYVGLISYERSRILEYLASASYGISVELLLIGDSEPKFLDVLRENAASRGEVNIVAPGFLPWIDVMHLVSSSDLCLYVFPTRPELDCVYPIKMGEYMELGKPVIATDSRAIREVYANCPGVIRCDTDRPQDWVSAIQTLSGNVGKRLELGADNRAFAHDRLDWAITQADLVKRLRALLVTIQEEQKI